jgi:hypothetical protein
MADLIEEALDDTPKEKSTEVTVDGEVVRIDKTHEHTPKNREYWRVAVYVANDSGMFSDIPDSKETNLDAAEADEVYTELVEKYDEQDDDEVEKLSEMEPIDDETIERIKEISEDVTDEHTEDNDIGREVSCEDCEQCGGTLYKSDSTVHATGFADSFEAECSECGHTQHIPAW